MKNVEINKTLFHLFLGFETSSLILLELYKFKLLRKYLDLSKGNELQDEELDNLNISSGFVSLVEPSSLKRIRHVT